MDINDLMDKLPSPPAASTPVLASIAIAAIGLIFLMIAAKLNRSFRVNLARSMARQFDKNLDPYRQRAAMLQTHALDYANAMSARKNNPVLELSSIMQQLDERITDVMELVDAKSPLAIKAAKKPLTDRIVPPILAARGSTEEVHWPAYLEQLMQTVGEAIYDASIQSRNLGLSGRGKQDTLFSLKEAGIDIDLIREKLKDIDND